MTNYSLSVKNNSTNDVRFAMFQQAPDVVSGQNVFTLAWFSKYAYVGTSVQFGWSIEYSAIWSRPGQILRPGVTCKTDQSVDMDLNGVNTVSLGYDNANDAFFFGPSSAGTKGSIFTNCDETVPNSKTTPTAAAGVGIAMSGAGTFLVATQPNINVTWVPKPKYYLVAGNYQTGQILDVQTIMGSALEIPYDKITSQSAELTTDNTLKLV